MIDYIAYLLLFALFLLCFYYERKEKKRKEHEDWIYDCRQCLVRITHIFRRDCQSLAENAFVQYSAIMHNRSYKHTTDHMMYYFLSEYKKSLEALEADYIENVTAKAKEIMRYYKFDSLPDFLVEEYTKEISDIGYAFCDFSHLMQKQIEEENKKYINLLSKGR